MSGDHNRYCSANQPSDKDKRAAREWKGLTDEERRQFAQWAHIDIIEDIGTKLKERNAYE